MGPRFRLLSDAQSGSLVSTCASNLSPFPPQSHPALLLSWASPVCPQGPVFHHLSPPLGDSDDRLPNSPTGGFTFCPANRIPIFRYGHRCAREGDPPPAPGLGLAMTVTRTCSFFPSDGWAWTHDHSGQQHRELLRNFDSCYLENHWEASCLLPFWFSCLACEGMMELQSPYDRAGKTKRIFKQPTQSCGHFERPTSRLLKHDSKVTQIMLLRTESNFLYGSPWIKLYCLAWEVPPTFPPQPALLTHLQFIAQSVLLGSLWLSPVKYSQTLLSASPTRLPFQLDCELLKANIFTLGRGTVICWGIIKYWMNE